MASLYEKRAYCENCDKKSLHIQDIDKWICLECVDDQHDEDVEFVPYDDESIYDEWQ
tara:strand:- start:21993 stop:22163 length:171 start_codon:yes stop_codon:yes gene_type:complete